MDLDDVDASMVELKKKKKRKKGTEKDDDNNKKKNPQRRQFPDNKGNPESETFLFFFIIEAMIDTMR